MNVARRKTDILILGAGGAGLFAALHAHRANPELDITRDVIVKADDTEKAARPAVPAGGAAAPAGPKPVTAPAGPAPAPTAPKPTPTPSR